MSKIIAEEDKPLLDAIPKYVLEQIRGGKDVILLDSDNLKVAYYKKDDWQAWADPMTYAILDDIILLEKMKLADLAAKMGKQ